MAPDHWPLHARRWSLLGPPLRPSAEDVAICEAAVAARGAVRALVLGVTPELVAIRWPAGSTVLAVDREPAMIAALFSPGPDRRACVGDWRALPVGDGSIDVVLGDGCANMFAFPADYPALAAELARVLAPDGVAIVRVFVSPPVRESLVEVAAALAAGVIGSVDVLKWRVAMAIEPPPHDDRADRNVAVTAILAAFDALVPDRAALAARTGWPRAALDHLDHYRDSSARYSFPTLAEVRAAFAPPLAERALHVPHYELGDRCPTIVLAAPRG